MSLPDASSRFPISGAINHTDDEGIIRNSNDTDEALDDLHRSYDDYARDFFNEKLTKDQFFDVCCLSWTNEVLRAGNDSAGNTNYKHVWMMLKQIYLSATKDDSSVIKWILPHPQAMISVALGFDDHDCAGSDNEYKARITIFWRELYKACENGSHLSSQEHENDHKSKRPSKRRRVGLHRFSPEGFKDLLKGRYKLPTIYLLLSLMKETEKATDWWKLCDIAHELPSTFKTFTENDVLTGLALVGLADISTVNPLPGLSASILFTKYLSGIESYGPSIFSILREATALDSYNLRASICRQVLDPLETDYNNFSEQHKSDIIDACAICIDQEHPERFLDEKKRMWKRNIMAENQSIPAAFASPGYPLLVHIQIWLLRHKVEAAARLTRKMDSSLWLDDKVRDDAWFNIWYYLLAEGIIFLDGNTDTPGYQTKREFLYNYMACKVSKNAKIAMIDFYQEVAKRVCEHKDVSVEEKQYVLLASQQTVLRLLLKRCGLGSKAIVEFVQETTWPVDPPGQKSAKDLDVWGEFFLLQNQKVPFSLIDKTSKRIDLLRRIDFVPETGDSNGQLDGSFSPTRRKNPSAPVRSLTSENEQNGGQEGPGDDTGYKLSLAGEAPNNLAFKSDLSSGVNILCEEDGSNENEILNLDDTDNDDEAPVVGSENNGDNIGVEEEEREVDVCESNTRLPDEDEDENCDYSDDEEVVIEDVDGNSGSENEENEGCDEEISSEHQEEELEFADDKDKADASIHEMNNGDGIDSNDRHRYIESDNLVIDEYSGESNDESYSEVKKYQSVSCVDNLDGDSEDSENFIDNSDRGVDTLVNVESAVAGSEHSQRDSFKRADMPLENEVVNSDEESIQALDFDIHGDGADSDTSANNNSTYTGSTGLQKSIFVKLDREVVEAENAQRSGFSPSSEGAIDDCESKKNTTKVYEANDHEQVRFQKVHKVGTEVAAGGGEFGDTTEEEADGNERFNANRTAQADRRADALRSGLGYASQDEDGYEPEDTHGYTEEEVSEAIHTEDEDDDRILKHKSPLFDTGTTQKVAGHSSCTNQGCGLRPLSEKSIVLVENTDRQNSIEQASDDMDMADERTEQEEDVGAEFSELEENPDCPSESKLPPPESTPAKTLLEFAKKAQTKDIWLGHSKEMGVDARTNDSKEDGLTDADHGMRPQETEMNKISTLSFDADDEKYATEGCKSLETVEEEESVKIVHVDALPNTTVLAIDENEDKGNLDEENNLNFRDNDENDGLVEIAENETQRKTIDEIEHLLSADSGCVGGDIEVSIHDGENAIIADHENRKDFSTVDVEKRSHHFDVHPIVALEAENQSGVHSDGDIVGDNKLESIADCDGIGDVGKNEERLQTENSKESYLAMTDDIGGARRALPLDENDNHQGETNKDTNDVNSNSNDDEPDIQNTVMVFPPDGSDGYYIGTSRSGDTVDNGRNETSGDSDAIVSNKSFVRVDIDHSVKASAVTELDDVKFRGEGANIMSTDHGMDHDDKADKLKTPDTESDDTGMKSDGVKTTNHNGNISVNTYIVGVDSMYASKYIENSVADVKVESSNANKANGRTGFGGGEESMSVDEASTDEISDSGRGRGLPAVDYNQQQIPDNNADNTVLEAKLEAPDGVIMVQSDPKVDNKIPSCLDEFQANEDECNDPDAVDGDFKPKDAIVEDSQVIAQDNHDDCLDNGEDKVESNIESRELQSIKNNCGYRTMKFADNDNVGVGIEDSEMVVDTENEPDTIDECAEGMGILSSAKSRSKQVHTEEEKVDDSNNPMIDKDVSSSPPCIEKKDSVEDEPSEMPQQVHTDEEKVDDSINRIIDKDVSSSLPCIEKRDSVEDEPSDMPQQVLPEEEKVDYSNNPMIDKGVSSSPPCTEKKDSVEDEPYDIPKFIGGNADQGLKTVIENNSMAPGTHRRTDEDSFGQESAARNDDESVVSETSIPKQVEELSTRVDATASTSQSIKKIQDKDSPSLAIKKRKPRAGLPPRPPEETDAIRPSNVKRRITRSNKNDDISVHTRTSTRSSSPTRKLSPGVSVPVQKGEEIENDEEASVQTKGSTRSTRSAARKSSSSTKATKQKSTRSAARKSLPKTRPQKEKTKEFEIDEVSVRTRTSTRSMRSDANKLSSAAKISKQKDEEVENDDNASVQTSASTRSKRSAVRKLSSSSNKSEHKDGEVENNDNISVQTRMSSRSSRRGAKGLPPTAKFSPRKDEEVENDDNISLQKRTPIRSTRSAARKLSFISKVSKQKDDEFENDGNVSVQNRASIRSTRSGTKKLPSAPTESKQKDEEVEHDDDMSVQTRTSTRSRRSTARKSSNSTQSKHKDGEVDNDDNVFVEITEYDTLTVKELRHELKKKEIAFPTKLRKKDLIELLKSNSQTN